MFSKLPTLVLCCSLISSGLGFGGREPKNTAPRDCYKAGMKNGPGIGFDLSSSYGIAAIRHLNGTIDDVAYVEIDADYRDMMKRFSFDSSKHPSPPYNDLGEEIRDKPRQLWRNLRKRMGLPASSDVGILGQLIDELRHETEARLGHRVESVVVTTPPLFGLYDEDITDALELCGLISAATDSRLHHHHQPSELRTAFAGLGLGLAPPPPPPPSPPSPPPQQQQQQQILYLSFTNDSLLVSVAHGTTAYDVRQDDNADPLTYWHLGAATLPHYAHPDDYWCRIYDAVAQPLTWSRIAFDHIILLGDRAADTPFVDTVHAALRAFPLHQRADMHLLNPRSLAARGAAEFALRAQNEDASRQVSASSSSSSSSSSPASPSSSSSSAAAAAAAEAEIEVEVEAEAEADPSGGRGEKDVDAARDL